jgi:uncharacterized membrane protein YsdA (DUF1294 family)
MPDTYNAGLAYMVLFISVSTYLLFTNLITYRLFANDKRYAIERQRRTPEATLLFWAAVGGWLGAKIAQNRLRHKSYKQPFGRRLNHIGFMHALSLGTFIISSGAIIVMTEDGRLTNQPNTQIVSSGSTHLLVSLRPPTSRPASW